MVVVYPLIVQPLMTIAVINGIAMVVMSNIDSDMGCIIVTVVVIYHHEVIIVKKQNDQKKNALVSKLVIPWCGMR